MRNRRPTIREAVALGALSLTAWLVSFPWLAPGPLGSAMLGAICLACAILAAASVRRPWESLPSARRHWSVLAVVAFGVVGAVGLVLSSTLSAEPTYLDGRGPSVVRLLGLCFLSYVAIIAVTRAFDDRVRWLLPSIGPVVTISILAVIAALYVRAGINPLDAYAEAFDQGTFKPLLGAVRKIHQDLLGTSNNATIRHIEIRGALCAAFLSLALVRPGTRPTRWVLVALALSVSFAVLQVSRANLVIVAITALGPLALFARSLGRRARVATLALVAAALFGAIQIDVISDAVRDGSNQSSEVRGSALADAVGMIDEAMLFGVDNVGADDTPVTSPHNMVLDLTLGAGLLGTVAALGLVVTAGFSLLQSFWQQRAAPSLVDAIPAVGRTGLFAIVFVRMMTGGGGLLDPVSWFAFGAALGLLHTATTDPATSGPDVLQESQA